MRKRIGRKGAEEGSMVVRLVRGEMLDWVWWGLGDGKVLLLRKVLGSVVSSLSMD